MEEQAKRLREARLAAGHPSARAAAISNKWKISTYTAHENGQNGFGAEWAELYAKAFKTRADWLMFGSVEADADAPGIDAQLKALPKDMSRRLIEKFTAMIEGVKIGGKLR